MTETRSSSRRTTPWSGRDDVTPLQAFIDDVNQRNYERRHPNLRESGEADFINSYIPDICRHCGSIHIKRFGKTRNGLARYRCNECRRTFTPLTNTIFDNHKIPITEWVDFLLSMFGYGSTNQVSKSNRNSFNTTSYWLDKVFLVVSGTQDGTVLSGTVQLDESYYSVRAGDIERKADGLMFRGTSRNQYCIGVACDDERVFLKVEGMGSPSFRSTVDTFGAHIEPGSHLVHDTCGAHSRLVKMLGLSEEIHAASETKRMPDKDNPLNRVNQICNLMKKFLNAHSGFLRKDLQNYLDLLAFIMNPPHGKHRKVERFMDLAMSKRILLRYNDKNRISEPD